MPAFFNKREKQFKALATCLNAKQNKDALELMQRWQPAYLALFQNQYPQLNSAMRDSYFDEFWQHRRESLSIEENSKFHFMAQPGISDADFVTGHLFYLLASKSRKDQSAPLPNEFYSYLEQSMKFYSIHGLHLFLKTLELKKSDDFESFSEEFANTLLNLHHYATLHGTPAYIQLADGYLFLATLARSVGKTAQSEAAFASVWKYLQLAQLAEKDSAVAIHNTHFGKGLGLSNRFKIGSIEEMLDECCRLAGKSLPLATRDFIKKHVKLEYESQKGGEYHEQGIGKKG